jgi:hypothetical protein
MSEIIRNYREVYWDNERLGNNLVGAMAMVAMFVCVINCAFPELEMFLTGGRVPVPQGFVKIVCFAFLSLLMLIYGKLDLVSFPIKTWIVCMVYLLLVFPFLWFVEMKYPDEILLAYNSAYCPLIFAPIVTTVRGKLTERWAMRIFMSTFAASVALGWAQFILQDPIVQLASSDGNFRIFGSQWMQGGERSTRAMSFFGNAQEFGSFLVLVAAIGIGMCGRRGGWKKGVPLYLFAAATCYTTLTRATFVQLFFASVAAFTFTFSKKPNRVRWQPLIALCLGLFIAFSGFSKQLSTQISDKKSLADDSSLDLRLAQWGMHISKLEHSSTAEQLFGLGFSQAEKPAMVPLKEGWTLGDALVDNLYLALVLHIGLVGAILMLALFWGMWRFIRNEALRRPTPLLIGIASYWATFLLTGMFNIQGANYGFWFLVGVMLLPHSGAIDHEFPWAGEAEPVFESEMPPLPGSIERVRA